jgi:hypothetical protein
MGIGVESSKSGELQNPFPFPKCESMSSPEKTRPPRRKKMPLIRQGLFLLGCLLIIVAPLVGAIPGPGGVFVFAAGLALVLQNSEWAKRQYVKFKRNHPNKGRWADWGMRRSSARRREELRKQETAPAAAPEPTPGADPVPAHPPRTRKAGAPDLSKSAR